MLSNLHIRNLAVIDEISLELSAGMTSLTGETGAGKSILVDALGLALGERADSDAVRLNSDRAEVSATFELDPKSAVIAWLQENDLNEENECLVRRVVTSEGRSRGYINGNAVPMQLLKQLGQQLVDICGQQAHQSLLRPAVQRAFLDQFGGLETQAAAVREAHKLWRESADKLAELSNAGREREERIDLLRYHVQELTALSPAAGEIDSLNREHSKAANAAQIAEGVNDAVNGLYDSEQSAQALVSRIKTSLESLAEVDKDLAPIAALLTEADIQISEAVDELRRHLDGLDTDPANFAELEARLSALHEQARKHRVEPSELPALLEKMQQELDELDNSEGRLDKLQKETDALLKDLQQQAEKLSKGRRKAAKELSDTVTAHIQTLGMAQGRFEIVLEKLDEPVADGYDKISFNVALNPGVKPGSLNKVASGGELSRVSLAIQVAARSNETVSTLIFDEVDAGVGGAVAETVGERLHELAGSAQVICVTHLPQVASQGDQQLRVSKLSDGKTTRTSIKELTADERVEEIARMLGGATITDTTREHAKEMLGS